MAKPLNQTSGMPQMSAAFAGWMVKINLMKIVQTVVDSLIVNTPMPITFMGVVQPLSPQQIMLKPEGQRSWEWLQIHCFSGAQNLQTNDRILYGNLKYKIMGIYDYSLDNFIEYHLVRDYQEDGVDDE